MDDKQLEFLQMWAHTCQTMLDWYVEVLEEKGPEVAFRQWNAKNENAFRGSLSKEPSDEHERFARDVMMTAALYCDLLIRWGCFDAK